MKWVLYFICFLPMFVPVARCEQGKPNIIILLADDLGYGDLGVYGHPTSFTPYLDAMAKNGLMFTQFYTASSICCPSRAALLTGRYPVRAGVIYGYGRASVPGLNHSEITIAEMLKEEGYRTAIIGKWHLGVGEQFEYRPMHQGFDYYLGSTPLCHSKFCFYPDIHCLHCEGYPSALIEQNDTIVEQPIYLPELTSKYITSAKHFIRRSIADKHPFFLYLAFNHVHLPQFAGKDFTGSTLRGRFGDSLAEMDWAVEQVLAFLRKEGIEKNTFVFFTSDNGPALSASKIGSPGLLRCGKGTTWDGGMRVPAIAYWPGMIQPGKTAELASTLDLLPTITEITGVQGSPKDVVLDGVDMSPILFSAGKSKRESFIYYPAIPDPEIGIYAVRWKQYKAHYYTKGSSHGGTIYPDKVCRKTAHLEQHDPPLLYDLEQDPGERIQLDINEYDAVMAKINQVKEEFESNMTWGYYSERKVDQDLLICAKPNCSPQPFCCKKNFDENYVYHVHSSYDED